MHIYLPDIKLKLGEAVDYRFDENLADCFDEFSEGGTLQLQASVSYSADKVLVSGSFKASVNVVCSRCLESFMNTFETDFTEAFTVISGSPPDNNINILAAETANMLTVTGDYLYLDEYVRQLIILAQEFSPLCKVDCKGICSGCGIDLNKKACSCSLDEDQVDVRLLKLKELKNGR